MGQKQRQSAPLSINFLLNQTAISNHKTSAIFSKTLNKFNNFADKKR